MIPLLLGVQYGLLLSILVGPLLIALLQASVEQGVRGGIAVGLGIWFSDLVFIVSVYTFFSAWTDLVERSWFTITVGGIGSLTLIIYGLLSIQKQPLTLQSNSLQCTYRSLWMKGFILNTVNPFTVFFWLFVMATVVLQNHYHLVDSIAFFSGLLGTIVTTDIVKIILSKKILDRLTSTVAQKLHKFSGGALMIFGMVLLFRSLSTL